MEKHGNNPLSREFSRELTSLATTFAKDREVRDIMDSREWYEKNDGPIRDAIYKGALVTANNILDENQQYTPNEIRYSWDNVKVTPFGDSGASIRTIFNILRDEKFKKEKISPIGTNPDGSNIYESTVTERIWNNEDTRKETALSILNTVFDPTRPDPGLHYLRANAEKFYPGDIEAQKAYVGEYIKNQGIPWNVDWLYETKSLQNVKSGDGGSKKKEDELAPRIGVATTVGKDYIVGSDGTTRILTTDALQGEAYTYQKRADDLFSTANLTNVSSSLFDGAGNLKSDAFVTDDKGYKLINTELITDPFEKATAQDLNMKATSAQIQRSSLHEIDAYYMSKAGLDWNQPLMKQIDRSLVVEKSNEALTTAYHAVMPYETEVGLIGEMAQNIYIYPISYNDFKNSIRDIGDETQVEAAFRQAVSRIPSLKNNPKEANAWVEKATKTFITERMEALLDDPADPKLKKYKESVEMHLNSTIYTQGYNYSIVKAEDKRRIFDILGPAIAQRTSQRSNFGGRGGNKARDLTPDEHEKLYETFMAKNADLNFATASIRFDDSRGEFVVDLGLTVEGSFTDTPEIIEIAGLDQMGLADLVRQQDPYVSNTYLTRNNSLITQLNESSGRYATVEMPIRDSSNNIVSNDRIVVKTAIQTHSTSVAAGDFLFCIPEIPDRVFVSKTNWGLINLTDAYREMKQAGKTPDQIRNELTPLMDHYNVKSQPNAQDNVGTWYFPTAQTRVNSVKLEVGK
jgi:hypothetical protein